MASETSKQLARSRALGARLWWLISGRAAAVVLLLLITLLWKRSTPGPSLVNSLSIIAPIILTVAVLTLIYSAAHLLWKNFLVQARIQFFVDVFLVTWLVWVTGNVHSPYVALYIVIISVASLFLGPRGAMITSVGSVAAFNTCALLAIGGLGPTPAEGSLATTIQTLGLSDVSFLVVGLLAAKLAQRQHYDVQLAVATRSLADLRA